MSLFAANDTENGRNTEFLSENADLSLCSSSLLLYTPSFLVLAFFVTFIAGVANDPENHNEGGGSKSFPDLNNAWREYYKYEEEPNESPSLKKGSCPEHT